MLCWSSTQQDAASDDTFAVAHRSDTARQRNRRAKSTTYIDTHHHLLLKTRSELSGTNDEHRRSRPFSAGDVDDLRVATIAGFAQSTNGTWVFKVNVGTVANFSPSSRCCESETTCYTIRRRFSDFKNLHEGLLAIGLRRLPPLPPHGVVSFLEMKLRPQQVVEQRAEALQQLLECINGNPLLASSEFYSKFIGTDPSSQENGYVSLAAYEAPTLPTITQPQQVVP